MTTKLCIILMLQFGFALCRMSTIPKCCGFEKKLYDNGEKIYCVEGESDQSFYLKNETFNLDQLSEFSEIETSFDKSESRTNYYIHCLDGFQNAITMQRQRNEIAGLTFVRLTQEVYSVQKPDDVILFLNLCCSPGYIFNYTTRSCEYFKNKNDKRFTRLLQTDKSAVSITNNPLDCNGGVLVSYNVPISSLSIIHDKYRIQWNSKTIELSKDTDNFCIELSSQNFDTVVIQVCKEVDYCDKHACLNKCSKSNDKIFDNGKNIYNGLPSGKGQSLHSFIIESNSSRFAKYKKVLIDNPDYGMRTSFSQCEIAYEIKKDWYINEHSIARVKDHFKLYDNDTYCMDIFVDKNNNSDIIFWVCIAMKYTRIPIIDIIRGILLITSCFFICLTILIHFMLPRFNNLYGQCLLQHSIGYLINYFLRAMLHFNVVQKTKICVLWGYLTVYSTFSILTWMNILCYLTWEAISSTMLLMAGIAESKNLRKTFINFCMYGWLTPLILTLIIFIIEYSAALSDFYKPGMSKDHCWFPKIENIGEFLFFVIPTLLFLAVNLMFFFLTMYNLNKLNTQMRGTDEQFTLAEKLKKYTTRFFINLKLLFMMGIPLIADTSVSILWHVNSTVFNHWESELFCISYVVNSLQGVVLFVIIIFRPKVLDDLKVKLTAVKNSIPGRYAVVRDAWNRKFRSKKLQI